MAARLKYSEEIIAKVLNDHKKGMSNPELAKKHGIPSGTIHAWINRGVGKAAKSQSACLQELADLITKYGPEISYTIYDQICDTPGQFQKYYRTWSEFRFEAAKLVPYARKYNNRRFIELQDGILMVISDLHYWPGWGASTAHRGFVHLAKKLKPAVIVLNGDVADFPQNSTHRPIGFKLEPTTVDEIDEVKERVAEIEKAAPGAERYINFGNHDLRPTNRLAESNKELRGWLPDIIQQELPKWKFQNAIRVNEYELEIKHRNKGGEYATANNVKASGLSYCVGHDHNFNLFRWRNLRGMFWGINTGLGADPWGPQFEYNENNTANHDSGFAVLTFVNGKLQPPEMVVAAEPGVIWFRGERIKV